MGCSVFNASGLFSKDERQASPRVTAAALRAAKVSLSIQYEMLYDWNMIWDLWFSCGNEYKSDNRCDSTSSTSRNTERELARWT